MKHSINFQFYKSKEEWEGATLNYFVDQGFKLSSKKTGSLRFKRGSFMQNAITFNPLKWKSYISIELKKTTVIANFNINTVHQAVTKEEKETWDLFISNYQKNLESGESLISENRASLRSTKRSAWKYIGWAFLGVILYGIPSGLIAYITEIDEIFFVGAPAGTMHFLYGKIGRPKT